MSSSENKHHGEANRSGAQEQPAAGESRNVRLLLLGFCALAALILTLCFTAASRRPDTLARPLTEAETREITERNSPLTEYILLSPNADFPREDGIRKITIHHMAGDLSLEALGALFSDRDRRSSASYGIDSAGRVGLYVEEENRP